MNTPQEDQDGSGYMLYHSVGQYHGKAADMARQLAAFSEAWARVEGGHWDFAFSTIQHYISRWQSLIGADDGTVTATENVTATVSALVNALPSNVLRGRTVLIAADCFPSNHFLLSGLADKLGFRLQTVQLRQGATWVEDEDMIAQWTPDVGLALLTWVSSVSSHRVNLEALVAHGRKMGTLVGVDITQAAGLLPFDVNQPSVDFAVSTSLKWLCGSPGAGMLYVKPSLIQECTPHLRGWFSQPDPFNWDISRFSYAPDIRRFDHGTPAVVSYVATVAALDWHHHQDHAVMQAHNLALCTEIQTYAKTLGFQLASPTDASQRGGSIMLRLSDASAVSMAIAALARANVQSDGRGRVLRMSPGILTTPSGVERSLAALRRLSLHQA